MASTLTSQFNENLLDTKNPNLSIREESEADVTINEVGAHISINIPYHKETRKELIMDFQSLSNLLYLSFLQKS